MRFSLVSLLVMSGWALAQGLPGRGMEPVSLDQVQTLVEVCESCHGLGGQTTRFDVPPIAGKPAAFILSSLEQFYYYERHCPDIQYKNEAGKQEKQSMCDITNAMNLQEGLALAQYFENQKAALPADDN
jgi:cytochrome c553